MDVATIYDETDLKPKLSISKSDRVLIDDAVDFSVLSSFEVEPVEGEPDLAIELIDLYLDDIPQKLKLMREALTLSDAGSLRDVAHSVKGSSSSLGAFQMATLCNDLEASANDLLTQDVTTFVTNVEHEFDRVRLAFTTERLRRTTSVLIPDVDRKTF